MNDACHVRVEMFEVSMWFSKFPLPLLVSKDVRKRCQCFLVPHSLACFVMPSESMLIKLLPPFYKGGDQGQGG